MPAANVFAPTVDLGGTVGVGPVSTSGGFSFGVADNHIAAGWAILGLLVLVLLWRSKFRFSTTVG